MKDTVDASSKYQDSLPISSDAIMERLDNWGIAHTPYIGRGLEVDYRLDTMPLDSAGTAVLVDIRKFL